MKIKSLILATTLATLPLVGCMQGQAKPDYITNASELVKAANWEQMQTITIDLDEYSYSMDPIELKQGVAYKMELKNVGEKKHYFTAPEFFKSIATRKVQSNKDGEIKAPYFLALEMMANGGQLDLYFVPVKSGKYPVYCTVDDHREQGMEGNIIVK